VYEVLIFVGDGIEQFAVPVTAPVVESTNGPQEKLVKVFP
jgi:hypothetical protein